ncbi:MAG: C26 family cysteine hydrolase domain-containing family [Lachnospiraceae bacterium]|nr:C26 family cysteine hydrolase domain-containing family [Lachnospiraceae bacterium]
MKVVLYTQRVELIESYGERRDCADQNIPRFIEACGYLPIPLPNIRNIAEKLIEQIQPSGIILTGGNSLAKYGGDAPERDEAERRILDVSLERDIPVYGFCRGMQVILDYFDCELNQVQGHVAVHHKVSGVLGELEVNSFHNQACYRVKDPVEVLAQTQDGVIEAVQHKNKRILGTMWHPERETPFPDLDIQRIQKLFG